ncbi:hypothetical protein [Exilibacterium tricleocarpae]|uniref:hypothetical protein n=1 Tax=Exilibacterium tricleocarpae TaxID=2591008 RepID=UPI00115F207A|nr:hypothetical protein [Exilibacterium tricleocarpae]
MEKPAGWGMTSEQLDILIDNARIEKTDSSRDDVVRALYGKNVFYRVDKGGPEFSITKDGSALLVLFTSPQDRRLSTQVGETRWEDALTLFIRNDTARAVVLQSSANAWLGIPRSAAGKIIGVVERGCLTSGAGGKPNACQPGRP